MVCTTWKCQTNITWNLIAIEGDFAQVREETGTETNGVYNRKWSNFDL